MLDCEQNNDARGQQHSRRRQQHSSWSLVVELRPAKTNELRVFLGAAPSSDWTRGDIVCRIVPGNPGRGFDSAEALKTDRRRLLSGYQGSVSSDMAPKTRTKKVDRSNILILIFIYTVGRLQLYWGRTFSGFVR